jgi:hypothetical protein
VVSYDKTPEELDAKFAAAIERRPSNIYTPSGQDATAVKAEVSKIDFDPTIMCEGVPLPAELKLTHQDKVLAQGLMPSCDDPLRLNMILVIGLRRRRLRPMVQKGRFFILFSYRQEKRTYALT